MFFKPARRDYLSAVPLRLRLMLYEQYVIDDLKDRADLIRIIEPYAALKKKGVNWMACCPFHDEKTPSFSVNPAKGFYKCFGCGKGGNAFTFLMEIEGLNFPEAVKRVAEITGFRLPEPVADEEYQKAAKRREKKQKLSDQIIELNRLAMELWERQLDENNAKAAAARDYIASRGISDNVRKIFRLGYAPDAWDFLLSELKVAGYGSELIEQSGLVSQNEEKDRTFDRFRGRLMFPVLDAKGNPVAFGARALGDAQPKYLNSPETPLYIKGSHLYGLFQSQAEIRKRKFAILVEGYLDLISLYQAGITNVAASLGTAFTADQAKLLGRFTKKIVVNYDGDDAGISAAKKAVGVLVERDFETKVLVLPDGQDPDDFVRAAGADKYNEARGKAAPALAFLMDASMRGRSLANSREKSEAIEEVLPLIGFINNPIQKRESFDQAMQFFRIDDAGLKRDLWRTVKGGPQAAPDTLRREVKRSVQAKITVAEQHLLELLVFDRELRSQVLPILEETDYRALVTAPVFKALFELEARGDEATLENLAEIVADADLSSDFLPLLMLGESKRADGEALDDVLQDAENCVFTLRSMAISNRLLEISQDLIAAEIDRDTAAVAELVQEHLDLSRMKQQLLNKIAER